MTKFLDLHILVIGLVVSILAVVFRPPIGTTARVVFVWVVLQAPLAFGTVSPARKGRERLVYFTLNEMLVLFLCATVYWLRS